MPQPYPLDRKLPSEVFPHRLGRSSSYINYPVFSWAWYWRRACVYGPTGIFVGVALVAPIGLMADEWSLLVGSVMRAAPAWVFIMLFGPALGTWVRHRRLPPARERFALVAAALIGIAAAQGVRTWYEAYLFEFVRPVLQAKGVLNAIPTLSTVRGLQIFYEVFFAYLILAAGGGRALVNYFYEIRRWQSHGTTQEIADVKRQRDDADQKLMVLQAQVEPHFLYNTLASVRSLVRSDPSRAEATIDALVDHLRATLPKFREAHSATVSLGEQLEICRGYLEVMRVRMGTRLSYTIDVPSDVKSLAFPPLLLVPLVENAIKHGVEPKPGRCAIAVRAYRTGGNALEVTVEDNGAGLREGPSDGVGLANIRSQLAARFGNNALLELSGVSGGGAIARIQIPVAESIQ
jgi:hypothetical protein